MTSTPHGRPLAALALAAVGAWASCGPSRDGPPNLILLSIDTLRADHLGCYGYPLPTSPEIDRLAERSVVYTDAVAPTPWTLPSHGALLTGIHPLRLGLLDERSTLPGDAPALAEALAAGGYQTAGFVDSEPGGFVGARRGFARGFGIFRHAPYEEGSAYKYDARTTVDAALTWLEARDANSPFFLFLHTKSVHATSHHAEPLDDAPYDKPRGYLERFLPDGRPRYPWNRGGRLRGVHYLSDLNRRIAAGSSSDPPLSAEQVRELVALYDAGVYYVDEQVGRLWNGLERLGLAEDTVLLLTADHGEAFLEHRFVLHQEVYQTLLHVPLILHDPREPGGERVTETVHLEDVAPTLLGLAGVARPPGLDGRELPRRDRPATEERESFAFFRFGSDHPVEAFALRLGRYKLVRQSVAGALATELYDLDRDPAERAPLQGEAARERALLARLELRLGSARTDGERLELDAEAQEDLRALGYAE